MNRRLGSATSARVSRLTWAQVSRLGLALAVALPFCLAAGLARADGLALRTNRLPADVRTALEAQVEAYRAQNPAAFDAIARVRGHRPEHYRRFRNPVPQVARELRTRGPESLLPMLEALVLRAPAHDGATAREREVLTVGLLDAVGRLRDPRSQPVLEAILLEPGQSAPVSAAAARALGKLGSDEALALLVNHSGPRDPLRRAAVAGLGECKRLESARRLAELLAAERDATRAKHIARALGRVGSRWAWRALGPRAAAEADAVSQLVSQSLARALVRKPAVRLEVGRALLMTDPAHSRSGLERARRQLSRPADLAHVDGLLRRLERR